MENIKTIIDGTKLNVTGIIVKGNYNKKENTQDNNQLDLNVYGTIEC